MPMMIIEDNLGSEILRLSEHGHEERSILLSHFLSTLQSTYMASPYFLLPCTPSVSKYKSLERSFRPGENKGNYTIPPDLIATRWRNESTPPSSSSVPLVIDQASLVELLPLDLLLLQLPRDRSGRRPHLPLDRSAAGAGDHTSLTQLLLAAPAAVICFSSSQRYASPRRPRFDLVAKFLVEAPHNSDLLLLAGNLARSRSTHLAQVRRIKAARVGTSGRAGQ